MCGILGLFLRDALVRPEHLEAMNATIVHRGPDEGGILTDGRVGLGMRRLSIIDVEGGSQPVANENGRVHVIQNGEIYNYRTLRDELIARGHKFRTHSDTEAIVHAYEEWGGFEFATHLRGMFAIAVWDANREHLWLVRDRLGIKPLYFADVPEGFVFGSEVKALLASPICPRELEPRILAQYLTFGNAGIEESFIKNVRQLRPGSVLRFADGGLQIKRYWRLSYPECPACTNEAEATEQLQQRLRETVRTHLVADVPVGAFLSGGVDSGSIVGTMAQEGCTSLKTFSIGFEQDEFNELPFANEVARRWRTDHHTEIINADDALTILDQLVEHFDEPFADASAIPTWYVSRLAARDVKVVLTGDGGDELFAGYTRYADFQRDSWLDRIPLTMRRWGAVLGRRLPHSFPGKYYLDYASHNQRARYVYNLTLMPEPLCRSVLRPEWHSDALGAPIPSLEPLSLMANSGATHALHECTYLDMLQYLPCDILVKVDRMTMAHSLEARPPLLDHEFLEFVMSLPAEMKYSRNGRQKHLFKNAVAPVVSQHLLDRKKAGFAVPLQRWFAGPLAPMLIDCVLNNGRCHEYVDPHVIRVLFDENQRGRRDFGLQLWAILMFELWLRRVMPSTSKALD
jgi:asparagine synthase (glutamine-hydrolysing)